MDPFRGNAERALERELLIGYEEDVARALRTLNARSLPAAIKLAKLPESIRGYGHVKQAQAAKASATRKTLVEQLTEH
jgi:indolepyruvate ferredoxin oxidoreductase